MSAGADKLEGGCLCGAVKFTATPKHFEFDVCHCAMCRKWTGGPLFAVDCRTEVEFEDETQIGVFQSSDWAERGFCRKCGSALFYRLRGDGTYQIAMGTIDGADAFKFDMQVFIDEKPEGYEFANDTKMMTGQQVFDYFAGGKSDEASADG